jgi:ATP-dependent exoDNAse (exonuclease V) beta subunit
MSKPVQQAPPPDQSQRLQALDPSRSILVQAPAGSGKTTLLSERFLTLLAEVEEPGQVVAITFTIAAAAEMRNRILDQLRSSAPTPIAQRVLEHSEQRGWKLLELPSQLRISTIDSFCRDLALQQPLLAGLGGALEIAAQPEELYRRAARQTIEQMDSTSNAALSAAVTALLRWRDNNWQEMEELLVKMLGQRDRWMQEFVLSRSPDWALLRQRLERPFISAVHDGLNQLSEMLDTRLGLHDEILELARYASVEPGAKSPQTLAACVQLPSAPFPDGLESARQDFGEVAAFLQTQQGAWRSPKGLNVSNGFPPTDRGRAGKARFASLIADLASIPALEASLAAVASLPPAGYSDDEWQIVRACFTLLRHAAGQLRILFAEAGTVDFIEVAQIAQAVLKAEDGRPSDAAIALADGIHHLLVDEFQDTSRRQHQLLASLVAAWPDRSGRSCFVVGDPMQSIYFFRDADAELFERVKELGLEIPGAEALPFEFVPLSSNFRTAPSLVERVNQMFTQVFATDDGSGVQFSAAQPARSAQPDAQPQFELHLNFEPQSSFSKQGDGLAAEEKEAAQADQLEEIVAFIRSHGSRTAQARAAGEKYRIAVLARAKKSLLPIAKALRNANEEAARQGARTIPFRAVELEGLADRPEVLDALALARALLNAHDRVAWLGVLRAPWCGLALDDLHRLTSNDDAALMARPISELLAERQHLLSREGQAGVSRILAALDARASDPTTTPGTGLQQVWLSLGGADCVDATARANIELLWNCLDQLADGQADLLGPALTAALEKLTALPDPDASADCGVQLMTIHKSKGLEFEVVIVPDLQAGFGRGSYKLLSWLERGVDPAREPDSNYADAGDEITEFLIAPLQSKGEDRGFAKAWVDRVYRQRETQETRRILYVAATRAREELHLFARPTYRTESDQTLTLIEPSASLLATARPALGDEILDRFEAWKLERAESVEVDQSTIESIAAAGESNLLTMPSPIKPTILRRLPLDYSPALAAPAASNGARAAGERMSHSVGGQARLYTRHEGGIASRALGTAVHALLEELAQLRITRDWDVARTALKSFENHIAAQARALGLAPLQAAQIAAQAMELALQASHDKQGQWILSPHPEAQSEVRWTGVLAGSVRTVQADRVFRGGITPMAQGEDAWWIVDYKTADAGTEASPAELRETFAPQLETYAAVLRNLHGTQIPVRAGLYYPRMLVLDWWEM